MPDILSRVVSTGRIMFPILAGLLTGLCGCVSSGSPKVGSTREAYRQDLTRSFILYADTAETAGMAILKQPSDDVQQAVRVVVHRKTGMGSGVELKSANNSRILPGEEVTFTCLVRAVPPLDKSESVEGSIVLHPNNPQAAVASQPFIARNTWVPVSLTLTADQAFAKDQLIVSIFAGNKPQSLEVGDARLINQGPPPKEIQTVAAAVMPTPEPPAKPETKVAKKPNPKPVRQPADGPIGEPVGAPQPVEPQPGKVPSSTPPAPSPPVKTARETPPQTAVGVDADWQKAARDRITELRMADIRIELVDAKGVPVNGADVSITLQKHAFAFGVAVNKRYLANQESRDQRNYGEVVQSLFNEAVLENGMKWNQWDSSAAAFLKEDTLSAIAWLQEHHIPVRGHVLVWPGWNKQNPAGLDKLSAAELNQRINTHITDIVGYFRGNVSKWDVVNELRTNRDFTDVLGEQAVAEWFRIAHQADPGAKLFFNEFGILNGPDRNLAALEKTVADLRAQKVPIHGIGLQGHFNQYLPTPAQLLARLDRLARLGLELQISEFDVDIQDEAVQASFTKDFYTLAFSHPAVTGITSWGLWEGQNWRPQAALYRKNWEAKPNGKAVMDLLLNQWHTALNKKTDRNGSVTGRGFLGTYEVVVRKSGQEARQTFVLHNDTKPVKIVLPGRATPSATEPVPTPAVKKPPVRAGDQAPAPQPKPVPVIKRTPIPAPVQPPADRKDPVTLPVRVPVTPAAKPKPGPADSGTPAAPPPPTPLRRYQIREVAPPPQAKPMVTPALLEAKSGTTIKVEPES